MKLLFLRLKQAKGSVKQVSGCGAVGSARRSGRRGRKFKSCHPDIALRSPGFPERRRAFHFCTLVLLIPYYFSLLVNIRSAKLTTIKRLFI
jgi:hypothetical protein